MKTKIDHDALEALLYLINHPNQADCLMDPAAQLNTADAEDIERLRTALTLKQLMDQMPGGFFIYRAEGAQEILYANTALVRIFHCASLKEFQKLTGNSFRGMVHPDDLDAVQKSIQAQISSSQYHLDYVEYRIITKNGEVRWLDDYGHFIHSDSAGNVFYVFVGDSTEKRMGLWNEKSHERPGYSRREKQMRTLMDEYDQGMEVIHQEYLRHLELIEGLSVDYESIFYADLDANQIKAYRVSCRFKKQFPVEHHVCSFEGFDADYLENWVYPDDRPLLYGVTSRENIQEKLSTDNSFHVNYRVYRDNSIGYIQLRVVNVGSGEHISQVVLGYRNIDKEIVQEMQQKLLLSEALESANMANNAKNLFLSNMSHEIRTPMNAIMGFVSLAKKRMNDKLKLSSYLDSITTSSEQLLSLINDVLEISKSEAEKIHADIDECSLVDAMQQIQQSTFPHASTSCIILSLDISGLKHDMVYTDLQKLVQILEYLIDNALKFTEPGGSVAVSVEEKDVKDNHTLYQFVVKDSGIGISKEFLEHIFEPFEREKNTTLSGIHGTGLGLTIAKKLADAIGAHIHVSSTLGKGSTFTVSLPLQRLEESSLERKKLENAVSKEPPAPRQKRILLVDDNEINLEIENEVLTDAGFLVDTVIDGSLAVDKMRDTEPGYYDLILMDIQMPVMDGYCATRAIRKMPDPAVSGIPIIAVSANTFEEDKKKALESGMNAHLPKPLDTCRLLELMQTFL